REQHDHARPLPASEHLRQRPRARARQTGDGPCRTPRRRARFRRVPARSAWFDRQDDLHRKESVMTDHKVVSREEWARARDELLTREKEHTRQGDELARRRRDLPWVAVEKAYSFDTDDGIRTLAELFDGRGQLLVYHFMFGPTYEYGCPTCSS